MSADLNHDVARDMQDAHRSLQFMYAAMNAYQAHATRFAWAASEEERTAAHAALDDYLDAFGAAHKRLEQARDAL